MLSKRDRFKEWRGPKYKSEKKFLTSALMISEYVDSVETLEKIKTDFANHPSPKYNELYKPKILSFGMIVYTKLSIDEAIENLEAGSEESNILNQLKAIFENSYDNPRHNATQNMENLFKLISQLLELYPDKTNNTKQAKDLCFTLYTILTMINGYISNLNPFIEVSARAFINLQDARNNIAEILTMSERKVVELDKQLAQEVLEEPNPATEHTTIQGYFNHQFLTILNTDGQSEEAKLEALLKNMQEVENNLADLIDARTQQTTLTTRINTVKELAKAAEVNEQQIRGRKYALSLVNEHTEHLNVVLATTYGLKKEVFEHSFNQLNSPSLYQSLASNVLYAVSWGTSLLTVPYRYVVPKSVQDAVTARIPATLDSECKSALQDLSKQSLSQLKDELSKTNDRVHTLQNNLFNSDKRLVSDIAHKSIEQLNTLLQANREAQQAVTKYREISESIREKSKHLNDLRDKGKVIESFIKKHDGFLVALSNFFARLSSIFKTETAQLIDISRNVKNDLDQFQASYKAIITEETQQIEDDPSMSKELKETLTQELKSEVDKKPGKRSHANNPSKQDIRLMISGVIGILSAQPGMKKPVEDSSLLTPELNKPANR